MKKLPIALPTSRWFAYAAAGAASGLVSASSAEGAIHYSGHINLWLHGSRDKTIQLAPGASLVFQHEPHSTYTQGSTSTFFPGFAGFAMLGGSIAGFTKTCSYSFAAASASNLDSGVSVAQRPFTQKNGVLVYLGQSNGCSSFRGQFFRDNRGYVGFRFDAGKGMQYGWARVRVRNSWTANYYLLDYAYADPGETILTGQRRASETSDVAEESLGALALGAVGVNAWRKRRQRRVT